MSDKNDEDYTESVSGFKIVGDWNEIVEHGERISYILQELDTDQYKEQLKEYNNWRPKIAEKNKDISKKTADKASIDEDNIEKDKQPKDEMNKAKKKASDSVSDITEDKDAKKAYDDSSQSAKHTYNAIRNISRKTFRKSEEAIYENVMTIISPYYFDNELVSANVKKKSDDEYSFEININIDDIKEEVSNNLQDIYDNKSIKTIKNNLSSTDVDVIDEEDKKDHIAAEFESEKTDEESK